MLTWRAKKVRISDCLVVKGSKLFEGHIPQTRIVVIVHLSAAMAAMNPILVVDLVTPKGKLTT